MVQRGIRLVYGQSLSYIYEDAMNLYPEALGQPGPPWCLAIGGSAQEVTGRGYAWARAGFTMRFLRGRKMLTYQGLFDECSAALQFPWYFGENGNAFDECITDLSWLPVGVGYVLVITDPADVLSNTEDDGLSWLIRSFDRACTEWSRLVNEGQPWDREPVPFHVVLNVTNGSNGGVVAMWEEHGATVVRVE